MAMMFLNGILTNRIKIICNNEIGEVMEVSGENVLDIYFKPYAPIKFINVEVTIKMNEFNDM